MSLIEIFIQRCFAAALLESLELEVSPENVIITPKGKNGEYDCRVNDGRMVTDIAVGTFYGYASYCSVCIAQLYDAKNNRWSFPYTWSRFTTHMFRQPTGWPAVAE
ncbi:MAG: hypothetical protein WA082_04950 [Candidatus Moraniibacteriota bacterium]